MFLLQCKAYFFLNCLKARYSSVLMVSSSSKAHRQSSGYFFEVSGWF